GPYHVRVTEQFGLFRGHDVVVATVPAQCRGAAQRLGPEDCLEGFREGGIIGGTEHRACGGDHGLPAQLVVRRCRLGLLVEPACEGGCLHAAGEDLQRDGPRMGDVVDHKRELVVVKAHYVAVSLAGGQGRRRVHRFCSSGYLAIVPAEVWKDAMRAAAACSALTCPLCREPTSPLLFSTTIQCSGSLLPSFT